MSSKLTDMEMDAWQALLHTHHQLTNTLDAELRSEHCLSLGDYDVLVRLARAPEHSLRMAELAQRGMISPSGLTRVVDGLVKEGLVERRRGGGGARVVFAQTTEGGHARVRGGGRGHLRGNPQHLTGRLSRTQRRKCAPPPPGVCG